MKFIIVLLVLSSVVYGFVPQLDGRIVGGHAVEIEQFPYQASVRIYDQHLCGGSIIDSRTILTAAHCVYGMDHTRYSVRVGATQHRRGTYVKVARVIINFSYNFENYDNDVAILKLETPLSFSTRVQAIQLQDETVPVGSMAWVSGWGITKEGSKYVPETLRAVDTTVIPNVDCNKKHNGKITEHMICAHTIGKDTCQGDSGGPLVSNGKQIGIVSWGYGCARPLFPGVYSNIADLYSWIIANK